MFTYADDLSTLRFMIDAFRKFGNSWKIIGGDLADTISLVNARIYTKLARNFVGSFNWKQSLNTSSSDLSSTIQHLVDETFLPVSVTYRRSASSAPARDVRSCDAKCVSEGLKWAEELGEMAQKGFSNVFKMITRKDFIEHDLGNYISQVYQKLMGSNVLKIKSSDNLSQKFYAQCSKTNPGGVIVMGINSEDKSVKTKTKFPGIIIGKINEVILRAESDRIYLNNRLLNNQMPIDVVPVLLEKLVEDEEMSVNLPPKSVGFWEIPEANLSICTEALTMKIKTRKPVESSMTNLLQELIQEMSEAQEETLKRGRRSIPRIFQHQKRDVSGKFKQILELFNKKIRGIQAGNFPTAPKTAQTYSAYQKPLIYTVSPNGAGQGFEASAQMNAGQFYENPHSSWNTGQAYDNLIQLNPGQNLENVIQLNAGQGFDNPIQLNAEQLFGQAYGGETVLPASFAMPQQKKYQKPKVQQAQVQAPAVQHISATLPVQETPFTGQILPGQTYQLTEAEAQAYLSGLGGQQVYQQPEEYQASAYANVQPSVQPIYLNAYPDGQVETAQAYPDLSSMTQTAQAPQVPQAYVLQSPTNQDNQMAYMMDPYPETWDSITGHQATNPGKKSSPNPAEKVKSSFRTGKFQEMSKDDPEIQLQLNKNDQVKFLGKHKEANNDNFADELSILTQLGYHEITHIDEEDRPRDEISSHRQRRSILSENKKRNFLDLDVFPISLEDGENAIEESLGNKMKSSLDDMLNFIPKALKKSQDATPHLQSIQSDSSEMKKQCKILSVAMENECLHDTLEDIRTMAKRAVKYISRKKIAQVFDWMLPPKLILKKRRFIRALPDAPRLFKNLEDALKTNKILQMNNHEESEEKSQEIDLIEAVKQEEDKMTIDEHSGEVQKSLNHFINMMNSHILSWWNLFA
ncbi:uncharacterized protein LOC132258840 [Phlebotomus argentipes]|uniref:uncharacterized protein LOC132258840 n=1 Tax=Phlebotomus argentipes TaxID=94469 RepID=UPI002892CC2B|nr:uncharacterized protein LOC132258840 [Phlebotomus argentipes]